MDPLYHAINRKGASINYLEGDAKASEEIRGVHKEASCTISNCWNNDFLPCKLPGANSLQYVCVFNYHQELELRD